MSKKSNILHKKLFSQPVKELFHFEIWSLISSRKPPLDHLSTTKLVAQ